MIKKIWIKMFIREIKFSTVKIFNIKIIKKWHRIILLLKGQIKKETKILFMNNKLNLFTYNKINQEIIQKDL
jgi:hypothetical protein